MRRLRYLLLGLGLLGLIVGALWFRLPIRNDAFAPLDSADAASLFSPDSGERARDLRAARDALAEYAGTYRYLDGVEVTIGETPAGQEAVAFYATGRIVIDREHTVAVREILAHEIWHVIDYRDNGALDWGEQVPPYSAIDYQLDRPGSTDDPLFTGP